jgi:hypothetical protein
MRPARIVAAVVLTAAVAATGSYLAYTGNHRAAAASDTTVAPAPSTTITTLPTAVTTPTTPGVSGAACSSQAILPLLQRKFDSGELVIVRADIKRCRNGYAHVFAISRHNPPGHPQYENEQLFLRDVNGSWQSVAEGTGIACSDADITAAMLRACRALDYPTHTTPPPMPRISDPAMAARQVFQAWQAGDRQRALQAATPAAVRTLFAFKPSQAKELRFTGCHPGTPGYDCFYLSTNVGLYYIDMRVQGGASAGYRVVSINALMRFGSPDTAAKYVVSAWLAGDRADARHAASKTVVDALWNHLGDRTFGPRFSGCTFRSINWGADCAFDYTTVGLGFALQVRGGALLGWNVEAIRFAQL